MGTEGTSKATSRRVAAVLVLTAVGVALLVVVSPPTGAQTRPWTTYPATAGEAQGSDPHLLVVGDSLTVAELYSVQGLAEYLTDETGRSTYVTATPGGQWVTYGFRGEQNGAGLVWEHAALLQPRLVVIALGTNDARIMTASPELYQPWQHYELVRHTVEQTLLHTRCVLLVNVREREVPGPGGMALADAAAVNDNLGWYAAASAAPGEDRRVFVADWNSHALLQRSWFEPGDVHLTWAGQVSYASFIADQAEIMIRHRSC